MGSGIAQVFAQHGFSVTLFDLNEAAIASAKIAIDKNLTYLLNKNKISTEEKDVISGRIRYSTQIADCSAYLVIEAIIEDLEAKVALMGQLASVNNEEVIFASNTSSLSITELQKRIPFSERVVGMHFFNPPYIMPLVEIVRGELTRDEIVKEAQEICERIQKQAVVCKDSPGFIVNRVARPYYLQALRLAEFGTGSIEEIDKILESTGFKMGPFRLMDMIGIDINLKTSESVYEVLGSPQRLKPSPLQREKVNAGKLGRKSGEGFYTY